MEEGDEVVGRVAVGGVFFLLLYLTVFVRSTQAEWTYNLSPIWSYQAIREGRDDILVQVIMNVLAFIPIGLLLGTFKGMKWWHVLLIGLCFSLLIELLQLGLKRGLTEIDDVVHNVVGCMMGFVALVGCRKVVAPIFGSVKESDDKSL